MKTDSPVLLRSYIQKHRSQLNPAQLELAANKLTNNLSAFHNFIHSTLIAAYSAVQGEIDPANALRWARENNKSTFLPITRRKSLRFARISESTTLLPGRFNIPIPDCPESSLLKPEELDLVLVPLLAFDENLNRLGMGGGFYDRSFAFRANNQCKPYLLGIAHEFQKVEQLSAQPWDIPLDAVITDQAVHSKKP